MLDVYTAPILEIQFIDWNMTNNKYSNNYWGKIVCDPYNAVLFSEDGTQILFSFGTNLSSSFNILSFLKEIREAKEIHEANKSHQALHGPGSIRLSEPPQINKLDIEALVKLKQSGHSVDEIVQLRKEGVL